MTTDSHPAPAAAPTTPAGHAFGWVPDLPDQRDHIFTAPAPVLAVLPAAVDLRPGCPATVYDQGQLGSCTANAIAAAFQFALVKQDLDDFMPSRLFIYYNERKMEHTVGSDSGAQIRDGIKSVAKQGVCTEDTWLYDITKFADRPDPGCYEAAEANQSLGYQRVRQSLDQLRGCLANGFPFVFGFTVYESFESDDVAATGDVPMPEVDEDPLGGHAVLAVGYDDAAQRFLVRNSWGPGWGQAGYFTIPYAYLTNRGLASDFWTVSKVE